MKDRELDRLQNELAKSQRKKLKAREARERVARYKEEEKKRNPG